MTADSSVAAFKRLLVWLPVELRGATLLSLPLLPTMRLNWWGLLGGPIGGPIGGRIGRPISVDLHATMTLLQVCM